MNHASPFYVSMLMSDCFHRASPTTAESRMSVLSMRNDPEYAGKLMTTNNRYEVKDLAS